MGNRRRLLLTALVAGAVAAGGATVAARSGDDDCRAKLRAGESAVRTDRQQWTDEDLRGIGDYVEIRWQVRALGDPCSRAPGPTDRRYQGIVRLRPQQARALAERHDWAASPDGTAGMWPALVPLAPPGVRWLRSETYDGVHQRYTGELFLDPAHSLAFFDLSTH